MFLLDGVRCASSFKLCTLYIAKLVGGLSLILDVTLQASPTKSKHVTNTALFVSARPLVNQARADSLSARSSWHNHGPPVPTPRPRNSIPRHQVPIPQPRVPIPRPRVPIPQPRAPILRPRVLISVPSSTVTWPHLVTAMSRNKQIRPGL